MPTNCLSQHLSGFRGGWFTSGREKKVRKKQIVTPQQSHPKNHKTQSKKLQYNEPKSAQNIEALFFII